MAGNREAERTHVDRGTGHQILVHQGEEYVGWCRYGPPGEVATIKSLRAYAKDLAGPADRLRVHR